MSASLITPENQRVDASIAEPRPPLQFAVTDPADVAELRQLWTQREAAPVLVAQRTDGTDASFAGLDIRTLVRGEHSAGRFAAHSVVLAPGSGMPTHYLTDAHSYILVTEGTVELGVGDVVETVGQHSLGYLPPQTRQSFRNTSAEPVTLMLVHSPAGSDRAFAAAHERWAATRDGDVLAHRDELAPYGFRFDDEPLDNDTLTDSDLPVLDFTFTGKPDDLEALRQAFSDRPALPRLVRTTQDEFDASITGETRRKHLLTGDDTGGNAMMNLLSGVPGMGAPPHHQPTEEEFFFITGGELTMVCATETRTLVPGALAFCPRNCTHGFKNESETETRFVTLNSPAGHERTMAALRQRVLAGGATKEQLHEFGVAGGFIFHSVDAVG